MPDDPPFDSHQPDDESPSVGLRWGTTKMFWVVAVVVALIVGFLAGAVLSDGAPGQPPAIEVARDMGMALPLAQHDAFADGVITRGEVEDAMERLRDCAEARDVGGYTELDEAGGVSSFFLSTDDTRAVESCRLQEFDATYRVWVFSERSD